MWAVLRVLYTIEVSWLSTRYLLHKINGLTNSAELQLLVCNLVIRCCKFIKCHKAVCNFILWSPSFSSLRCSSLALISIFHRHVISHHVWRWAPKCMHNQTENSAVHWHQKVFDFRRQDCFPACKYAWHYSGGWETKEWPNVLGSHMWMYNLLQL